MANTLYRIRLSPAFAREIKAFAADWDQTFADVVRDATRYVLAHPHLYAAILAERRGMPREDPRSPAQVAAWEAYAQELGTFDLATVFSGEHGFPCEQGQEH